MRLAKSSLSAIRHYLMQDVQNARLRTGVRLTTLGIALLMGVWIAYFLQVAIAFPYPVEYREGAQQVMTRLLLEGRNPFLLENQPLGMNNYGILYSLTALPLAAAFGNTLLVHRIVTLVFLILCSLLVFRTSFVALQDAGLAILCGEMTLVALAAIGGLGAFPGAMGTFLFLTAILIPFNRHFDRTGLVLSAVLCLLAFYTKPYFMLAVGIVATYVLLFVSWKKALFYGLLFVALFGSAFFFVRATLPLYYLDVLVSNLTQAGTVGSAPASRTLQELGREFLPSLVAAAVILLAGGAAPRSLGLGRAEPRARQFNFFAYAWICGLLAFILILGANNNYDLNNMAYSYELVAVPFCLWLFCELKPRSRLNLILAPVLLFNLVLLCQIRFNPNDLSQLRDKTRAWERLYEYVDSSDRILNSPELASGMLRAGLWPVDSGQTEYYYWIRDFPELAWLGPSYSVVKANGEQYLEAIRAAVESQSYDYIIVTSLWALPHDADLIAKYYERTKVVTVSMPLTGENWDIGVWEPIK